MDGWIDGWIRNFEAIDMGTHTAYPDKMYVILKIIILLQIQTDTDNFICHLKQNLVVIVCHKH